MIVSKSGSSHMIVVSWLVGGNWQVTQLAREKHETKITKGMACFQLIEIENVLYIIRRRID